VRPVTDEELMMWADGELDPSRAAEVEAILQRDPRARAVVAALKQAGDLLASEALEEAGARGADSLAARVMAAIDAEAPPMEAPALRMVPSAAGIGPSQPVRRAWRAPIVAIGTVALAAAAAAMLWMRDAAREHQVGDMRSSISANAPVAEPNSTIINVVDFGARSGTIFYVPSEGESDTAVVWLTDDDSSPSTGESEESGESP
jgi:anti-sigma factor RsiW